MVQTAVSKKSQQRDRLKHSAKKHLAKSPKGGFGSKGTWGSNADDMKNFDLDAIREQTTYVEPEEEYYEEEYVEETSPATPERKRRKNGYFSCKNLEYTKGETKTSA
eukprot:UN33285